MFTNDTDFSDIILREESMTFTSDAGETIGYDMSGGSENSDKRLFDMPRVDGVYTSVYSLEKSDEYLNMSLSFGLGQVEIIHESILYLEVMDHVLTIHTLSGNYDIRTTLTQILGMLPEEQFCRCHNSYAVNLARIADISRTAGITLDCSVNLPIGRKYYNDVQQRFIKFINRN